MSFAQRTPSTKWEAILLPTTPVVAVWGWFKPAHAPNSVVLRLPPELWQAGVPAEKLTLGLFVSTTGVDPLIGWTLFGQMILLNEDTLKWLEARLPPPPPDGDQLLILWSTPMTLPLMAGAAVGVPQLPMAAQVPAAPPSLAGQAGDLLPGEDPGPLFGAMAAFWTNILYLESDIRRARMQLEQSASKLSSLNRDLSFEEQQAADSVDRQNWMDARRWLRDAAGTVSKSIKEIDVGLLSSAGQRNKFADLIERCIQPRIPFPGMKQTAVEFEMHHKAARILLQTAQTAISKGTADGERRANGVLSRIATKIQQKSVKSRGKNA